MAGNAHTLAFSKQHRHRERDHGRAQRPFVTLDRLPRQTLVDFARLHFGDAFGDQLLHCARSIFQVQIKSAGRLCDFAQALFVQLGFHHLALGILHERRSLFAAAERNERPFGRSDADRENPHSGIRCSLCRLNRVTGQLFAVGKDHQSAISDRAFAISAFSQRDRFRNVGAAFRNRFGIEIMDRFDHGIVIDCQRRLDKGASGECDQSNPIAL